MNAPTTYAGMTLLFANNATSRLYAAIGPADTGVRVQNGDGDKFPTPDGTTTFTVTLEDRRTGQVEICMCTSRSGDILNVTRAQEGTTAQAFAAWASVSNRMTAATMDALMHAGGQGPQGIQGEVGPQGPQGEIGPTGADSTVPGPQGVQGLQGDQGVQGEQGIQGDKGDQGDQGEQGLKGDTGAASIIPGPTGPGVAAGGTTGQFMVKLSNLDYVTGWQTLDKTTLGLNNVDNTSDANKPVSTAQAAADNLRVLKAGDTMTGQLVLPTGPGATNAVRKDYVDNAITASDTAQATADALRVLKAGDTMTGQLVLPTGPGATNAVRKDYVDTQVATKIGDAPSDGLTYGRKNLAWATIVGGAVVADAAPGAPLQAGQLWWESDTGNLFIWYTDANTSQWVQINVQSSSGMEGEIAWFARQTPPAGFLEANGASLLTAVYPNLFAAIGYAHGGSGANFNVPDLRGEFVRGWDHGRGIDAARAFGSAQAGDQESHQHGATVPDHYHGVQTAVAYTGGPPGMNATGAANAQRTSPARYSGGIEGGAIPITTSLFGGTETRPRNIAMLACIRF